MMSRADVEPSSGILNLMIPSLSDVKQIADSRGMWCHGRHRTGLEVLKAMSHVFHQ